MKLLLTSVSALILLMGTAWSAPCDLKSGYDRKSCLIEERNKLAERLAFVNAEISAIDILDRYVKRTLDNGWDFWLTLDVGVDVAYGLYTSVGVSVPLGPIYVSPGVWFGSAYGNLNNEPERGWYLTVGYSWTLME